MNKPYQIECNCRGHREPISGNDCICSPHDAEDLSTCQRIEEATNYPSGSTWKINEEAMEKSDRMADIILGFMLLMTALTLVGLLMVLFI